MGILKLISELQKEQKNVEDQIESIIRGESNINLKRKNIEREERILAVFNERNNKETLEFLRGLAHNLKF